jgi:conjugative transfer pilus assembly protein TraH
MKKITTTYAKLLRRAIKAVGIYLSQVVLIWSIILMPNSANAGWLQDFANDAGAMTSSAGGGSHQGQSMNMYTGGSFVMRVPQKNYQMLDFRPPSLTAGCGGIDAFAGSFSFINKDAFVAMLKNIGQAAIGQAFMLALKSLAPEVAEVMSYLQQVAQKANGLTVNSCEAAGAIVDGVMGQWARDNQRTASITASKLGVDDDMAAANRRTQGSWYETLTGIGLAKTSGDHQPQNGRSSTPTIAEGNVVWRALSQHTNGLTIEQRRIIMSLTGTVILKNDPNAVGILPKPSLIEDPNVFMGGTNATTDITVYKCLDGYGDHQCQDMIPEPMAVTAFTKIVQDRLTAIRNNMMTRTAQTSADLYFVNSSSIPIQRILSIGVVNRAPGVAQTLTERYQDVVAAELAVAFVAQAVDTLKKALAAAKATTTQVESTQLRQIEEQGNFLKQWSNAQLRTAFEKSGQMRNIASELEHMERAMYSTLPSGLASSISFDRKRSGSN